MIKIDFLSTQLHYRRKHASLRSEMVARALGLKTKSPVTIIDATAGLARDSFILASLGFNVTLLERSSTIFTLLTEAMQRASLDEEVGSIIQRMHLIHTDAITWLTQLPEPRHPDIIYLDPMFPKSKKSALSQQDMRLFHEIVGDDPDAGLLLEAALSCAKQRVVVKRPRLAEPLGGLQPTFSMKGSSNRFDIYLTRDRHGLTTAST